MTGKDQRKFWDETARTQHDCYKITVNHTVLMDIVNQHKIDMLTTKRPKLRKSSEGEKNEQSLRK